MYYNSSVKSYDNFLLTSGYFYERNRHMDKLLQTIINNSNAFNQEVSEKCQEAEKTIKDIKCQEQQLEFIDR